jgi:hypothetical protein
VYINYIMVINYVYNKINNNIFIYVTLKVYNNVYINYIMVINYVYINIMVINDLYLKKK